MHLKLHGRRIAVISKIFEWLEENIDDIYEENGHRMLGVDKEEDLNDE